MKNIVDKIKLAVGAGEPEQNVDNYTLPSGHEQKVEVEHVVTYEADESLDDLLNDSLSVNPKVGTVRFEIDAAIQIYLHEKNKEKALPGFCYRLDCLLADSAGDDSAVIERIKEKIKQG